MKIIRGNNNLRVANDTDGYDKYFKVDNINFKHGTLLIRYIDENGNTKDLVINTDFTHILTKSVLCVY